MDGNAGKYNRCNNDTDGYCIFEKQIDDIMKIIHEHVEEDGYMNPCSGLDKIVKVLGVKIY